jgi:ferritin-like protein
MSSDHDPAVSGASGGQGRLAELIATRGGLAAPEAPFVIEHREALIYMLCQAAELEQGIMCQYLFAAFSLKQGEGEGEGLSGTELDTVRRWRKQVSHVAAQEMLHLALVQNVLSAIGAAPHLSRPNLPEPLLPRRRPPRRMSSCQDPARQSASRPTSGRCSGTGTGSR